MASCMPALSFRRVFCRAVPLRIAFVPWFLILRLSPRAHPACRNRLRPSSAPDKPSIPPATNASSAPAPSAQDGALLPSAAKPPSSPTPSPVPSKPDHDAGQAANPPDRETKPPAAGRNRLGGSLASSSHGRPLSLNFDDADVYQVAQTVFGDVLKVNYIVDARVKGRVTFRSSAPLAYDQILPVMEVILRVNGIGVVEDEGLYRIVPIGEVSREPSAIGVGRDLDKIPSAGKSIVQVIPIITLQSSDVVKLLTPFLSANAVMVDIPKSNQIIVVDTDANVKRLIRLVDAFDSEQQKHRKIQVYVYPIQNGKAKNAGLLQQIFLSGKSALPLRRRQRRPLKALPPNRREAEASLPSSPPVEPLRRRREGKCCFACYGK